MPTRRGCCDDGLVGGDFNGEPGNPGSKVPDGNDVLEGGNGNDFAAGNPALDPNPNSDSCSGGHGSNLFAFCETTS